MVPWGRSRGEYARMFALTPRDLRGSVLDCAAGPASFNAEATAGGHRVVSCDPLYRLSGEDIRSPVEKISGTLMAHARAARNHFVWRDTRSPEHLGEVRLTTMDRFRTDSPPGLAEDRCRTS